MFLSIGLREKLDATEEDIKGQLNIVGYCFIHDYEGKNAHQFIHKYLLFILIQNTRFDI